MKLNIPTPLGVDQGDMALTGINRERTGASSTPLQKKVWNKAQSICNRTHLNFQANSKLSSKIIMTSPDQYRFKPASDG
jgi:hypothetical protein